MTEATKDWLAEATDEWLTDTPTDWMTETIADWMTEATANWMTEAIANWMTEALADWMTEAFDWSSSDHSEGVFSNSVMINAFATEMSFSIQTSRRFKESRSSSNLSFETTWKSSSVVSS
jgi:hypothetical protein